MTIITKLFNFIKKTPPAQAKKVIIQPTNRPSVNDNNGLSLLAKTHSAYKEYNDIYILPKFSKTLAAVNKRPEVKHGDDAIKDILSYAKELLKDPKNAKNIQKAKNIIQEFKAFCNKKNGSA